MASPKHIQYSSRPVIIEAQMASGPKHFYVHEELLRHHSRYYRAFKDNLALRKEIEQDAIVRPWAHKEVDGNALNYLVDWLYRDELRFFDMSSSDPNLWAQHRELLIKIYALADPLQLIPLQNAIVKICFLYYKHIIDALPQTKHVHPSMPRTPGGADNNSKHEVDRKKWEAEILPDLKAIERTGSSVWFLSRLIIDSAVYYMLDRQLNWSIAHNFSPDSGSPNWIKSDLDLVSEEVGPIYAEWFSDCKIKRPSYSTAHEPKGRDHKELRKRLKLENYLDNDMSVGRDIRDDVS